MAIVKTFIGEGSLDAAATALYNYLLDNAVPKYFDSVTQTTSTNPTSNVITCYAGELALLTITLPTSTGYKNTVKITTKAGYSTSVYSKASSSSFLYAYGCTNGILLTDSAGYICICKTNNGETAVVYPRDASSNLAYDASTNRQGMQSISVADGLIDTFITFSSVANMTVLCPIPTCSSKRYLKDVFYTPFIEVTSSGIVLDVDGVKYLSTGLFCIKDE